MAIPAQQQVCPVCEKPTGLCICASLAPIDNRIEIVILRHPQEQDRILGTARIATLQLRNSQLKTGLSWPSLAKLLGRPAESARWGVLYLGTAISAANRLEQPLSVLGKDGEPLPDQDRVLRALEGVILLDGNWRQAKALWWRNPWMLKCMRLVLNPQHPSLYGALRREPRRESVSTLEAAALTLAELERDPGLPDKILPPFRRLLGLARGNGRNEEPKQSRWTS